MNPSPSEPRLLDGNRTTVDWQTATTRIAVLPIGAFEQHARTVLQPLLAQALGRREIGVAVRIDVPNGSLGESTNGEESGSQRHEQDLSHFISPKGRLQNDRSAFGPLGATKENERSRQSLPQALLCCLRLPTLIPFFLP